jgi:hypothetical protein
MPAPAQTQTHDHSHMPMHDSSSMAMPGDGEFNPFVISDAHGGFYAVYIQRKNDKSDVFFQHAPAGAGFSAAVRVNDVPGDAAVRNENPPKIAAGPNNEIYVAWANERQRWKGNIRFSRSLDGGKTFSPAIYLNTDTSGALIGRGFETIAVDQKGHVYVAWIDQRDKNNDFGIAEIWMAESGDNGKTFSHDHKIISNVCDCCRLTLAIDSAGRMFISYRYVPPSGPMFRDIAVARSGDGGKTFQSTVVSHDGWELNGCPTNGASLSVDNSGRVNVIWFTAPGNTPRLYIASSTDHGASFVKPALLDPAQKQAKHGDAVAVGDGVVLAAWDDVNDSSLVKWGIYNLTSRTVRVFGSEKNAYYPIVAASGKRMAVIAMQPDHPELVRSIEDFTVR